MDERSLRVLEFEKVRAMLAGHAACSLGKARALALEPATRAATVREALADTSDARRMIETQGPAPLGGLTDIGPHLGRARVGALLGPEELLQVADALRCTRRVREHLLRGAEAAPRLAQLGERLVTRDDLEAEIERCVDENANVRRTASAELDRLSARAEVLERRVRERIEGILRREAERGVLQEPVIVQRAGRFCLPVQAPSQSRFRGIIHDRSDSGATVFMEPLEVVEIGNELRGTNLDIAAAVERILRTLSARLGEAAEPLEANLELLGDVDAIMARGRMSAAMNGCEPALVLEPRLDLRGARHPLLGPGVVPINVWLGDEFDTVVITGPNTGGKTVTLKTVGLLALMTQCGLHIPADPGSVMTVWNHIYADIGDEQSIEQSLSTFSSHMTQIVKILNRVGAHRRNAARRGRPEAPIRALVLLDEIGAGTDPTEGSALARTVLTELHEHGCRTLATTHYNDLKVYAYGTPGVQNASVEFDLKTLKPTYRLLIGHAGSSNAFEIAQHLGLARRTVQRAREYLGEQELRFEQAMGEVEQERAALSQRTRETASAQRDLDQLRHQYQGDLEQLEQRRRQALEEGFAEAEAIVRRAEERAREIIADLQRQSRQSRVTEERRREVSQLGQEVRRQREQVLASPPEQPEETPTPETQEPTWGDVSVGDRVHVPEMGRDGTVSALLGEERAEVEVGRLRVEVKRADLRPAREQPREDAVALAEKMKTRKAFAVPRELDLRGMTLDEALPELDKYLDDAALARFPEVRIIHGKGTGALRQGVHEYLRRQTQVRGFHLAEHAQGGEGVTEVKL